MSRPAITTDAILTSARTRADGSLGLALATPELTAKEKTAFFELLNQNLKLIIQPKDESPAELHDVKSEFETRSSSQRLRAVLFIEWKQIGEAGEYEDFYRKRMNQIIEDVKKRLNPE